MAQTVAHDWHILGFRSEKDMIEIEFIDLRAPTPDTNGLRLITVRAIRERPLVLDGRSFSSEESVYQIDCSGNRMRLHALRLLDGENVIHNDKVDGALEDANPNSWAGNITSLACGNPRDTVLRPKQAELKTEAADKFRSLRRLRASTTSTRWSVSIAYGEAPNRSAQVLDRSSITAGPGWREANVLALRETSGSQLRIFQRYHFDCAGRYSNMMISEGYDANGKVVDMFPIGLPPISISDKKSPLGNIMTAACTDDWKNFPIIEAPLEELAAVVFSR